MEFMHIGVPTRKEHPGEVYKESMKVYITNPDNHDYKFEYLRYMPDSTFNERVRTTPHIAVKVDDIEEELKKCDEILVEPFPASGGKKLCFAVRDGVIFEFMQFPKE